MINKLTGMPVSEEALKVLDRLASGELVPYEEIKKLPEIKEAYTFVNNSTETTNLPHRENLQKGIQEKLLNLGSAVIDTEGKTDYNGIVGRDGRIDIVIGLPASGKSSTLVNPLSQEFHSRVIDSDMAKEFIPEFNGGWGAGVVHEESKKIIQEVINTSIQKHENIVLPIVGSNIQKLQKQLLLFQAYGYETYLHFADIAPAKTLGRMLNRFFEEGRFLDPRLIYEYGDRVTTVYNEITKGGLKNERNNKQTSTVHGNMRNDDERRRLRDRSAREELERNRPSEMGGIPEKISRIESVNNPLPKTQLSIAGYSHWSNDVPRGHSPLLLENTCQGNVFDLGVQTHFSRELHKNGFIPNNAILNSCVQLYHHTGKLTTLKEICSVYKNPSSSSSPEELDSIKQIGDLCRMQEAQRCPSFSCSNEYCPEL